MSETKAMDRGMERAPEPVATPIESDVWSTPMVKRMLKEAAAQLTRITTGIKDCRHLGVGGGWEDGDRCGAWRGHIGGMGVRDG